MLLANDCNKALAVKQVIDREFTVVDPKLVLERAFPTRAIASFALEARYFHLAPEHKSISRNRSGAGDEMLLATLICSLGTSSARYRRKNAERRRNEVPCRVDFVQNCFNPTAALLSCYRGGDFAGSSPLLTRRRARSSEKACAPCALRCC